MLDLVRFFIECERPIHLSKFPVLATIPKRFCNDCETSELFRLHSIIVYLRPHGRYSDRTLDRLTFRYPPLFRAARQAGYGHQVGGADDRMTRHVFWCRGG
jgi:hypothetical protein